MSKIDNKFGYWCAGWLLMLRHPISRAIDLGKSMELLVENQDEKHD